jgi:hypothetical protein
MSALTTLVEQLYDNVRLACPGRAVYHFHKVQILQSATWIIRRKGTGVDFRRSGDDMRFFFVTPEACSGDFCELVLRRKIKALLLSMFAA